MLRTDVMEKVLQILDSDCDSPSEELIRTGECLVVIGNALKPLSVQEARQTMLAVMALM